MYQVFTGMNVFQTDSDNFFDPQLFRGVLYKGKLLSAKDTDFRNGLWRENEALYYRLDAISPYVGGISFTGKKGIWRSDIASYGY